jgi:hypothetical protein
MFYICTYPIASTQQEETHDYPGYSWPYRYLFYYLVIRAASLAYLENPRCQRHLALATYLVLTIGLSLWLTYGLLKGDLPLVVANSVMVVLTAAITIMKIVYDKRG